MSRDSARLFRRAEELIARRRVDEANVTLDELERIAPLEAQIGRAQLELLTGRPFAAVRRLEAAIAEHPPALYARTILSAAYLLVGRHKDARATIKTAMRDGASDVVAWYNLGRAELAINNLSPARDAFERALELDPESAAAMLGLAQIDHRVGRLDRVLERIGDILPLDPYLDAAYTLACQVFITLEQPEDAQEMLEGVLEAEPTYLPAGLLLLEVYARTGRLAKADTLCEQLGHIAVASRDVTSLMQLAGFQVERGRAAAAEELLRRAILTAPDYAEIRMRLAQLYAHAGESEMARATLEEALVVDPDHPEALAELAAYEVDTRSEDGYRNALALTERALALHPGEPRATFNKALAVAGLEGMATARPLFEQVANNPLAGALAERARTLIEDAQSAD